jgi:hypothetical protein
MRIVTEVLAMEVKLCLVVAISQVDVTNAQSSKDAAHDADAPARAKCSELQSGLRVPEFGQPRARTLNSRQKS